MSLCEKAFLAGKNLIYMESEKEMDKKLLCSLLLAAAFIGQAQTAQAATVSKMPGTKNMGNLYQSNQEGRQQESDDH